MFLDEKTLAVANLAVQALLMAAVIVAATIARRKGFKRHCTIMRVAVPLQLVAVVVVMLPSMLGFIRHETLGTLLNVETLIHHGLGVAVVALWIYINLVALKVIRRVRGRFVLAMRLALGGWVLSFMLGAHIYTLIWR